MLTIAANTQFNFMQNRRIALALSAFIIIASVISLSTRWLSLGIDFTGGTLIEIGYPDTVDLPQIREQVAELGFDNVQVQHFGSTKDILIRVAPQENTSQATISNQIFAQLREEGTQLRRAEFIGPQIGQELREDGGLAMLYALIGILIYVGFRFEFRFAIGAIIALAHDVIATIGFFSITGIEFNLTVLAAILAVIGYSLNDTIVVYDRIRESYLKSKTKVDSETVVNQAINRTLSRTLITSLTTMMVLLALLVFGGEIIRNFTIALVVGVFVGTYSSIYVASSLLLILGVKREHMIPAKKEGADIGVR